MPRFPSEMMDCGNRRIKVDAGLGYALIRIMPLPEENPYEQEGLLYFGNLAEIRQFHERLGRALKEMASPKVEANHEIVPEWPEGYRCQP